MHNRCGQPRAQGPGAQAPAAAAAAATATATATTTAGQVLCGAQGAADQVAGVDAHLPRAHQRAPHLQRQHKGDAHRGGAPAARAQHAPKPGQPRGAGAAGGQHGAARGAPPGLRGRAARRSALAAWRSQAAAGACPRPRPARSGLLEFLPVGSYLAPLHIPASPPRARSTPARTSGAARRTRGPAIRPHKHPAVARAHQRLFPLPPRHCPTTCACRRRRSTQAATRFHFSLAHCPPSRPERRPARAHPMAPNVAAQRGTRISGAAHCLWTDRCRSSRSYTLRFGPNVSIYA